MKKLSNIKKYAVDFLESYKAKGPATYAAAQQAIGAVLIADGLFGIENPFGAKKRPGIFGTFSGMIIGVIFMLVSGFIGGSTNIKHMTATTPAEVVSVGNATNTNSSGGSTCGLVVRYAVNGQEYTTQSSMSSSEYCALGVGQSIVVNYDPNNPASWAYGTKTIKIFLGVFFWVGVFVLVSSIFTFFVRLFSIIFGWKLLRSGRKNAAALPAETDMSVMVSEIKQSFTSSIFAFGGVQGAVTSALTQTMPPSGTERQAD